MGNYLPICFDIENRPILIFGGGSHAYEKIEKLLPYNPALTVAAEKVTPTIKRYGEEKRISIVKSNGTGAGALISRLKPLFVIIADVEEEKIADIYKVCRKHGVQVNTPGRAEFSTFLFPAVIRRKNFSVAIAAFGASSAAAKWVKDYIEKSLPAATDSIIEHFGTFRQKLAEKGANLKTGKFATMYREFLDTALRENRMLTAGEMTEIMTKYIEEAN